MRISGRAHRGASWSWTILPPGAIVGDAIGANMNITLVLALFAALRKEAGLPLPIPDGVSMITDIADADLLGRGAGVGGRSAKHAERSVQPHQWRPVHATRCLPHRGRGVRHGDDRAAPVRHRGGTARARPSVAGHDRQIWIGHAQGPGCGAGRISDRRRQLDGYGSVIKIRQAGFQDCMDTADMYRRYMRRFQEAGMLPPAA